MRRGKICFEDLLIEFDNELDDEYEQKTGIRDDLNELGLSNWWRKLLFAEMAKPGAECG